MPQPVRMWMRNTSLKANEGPGGGREGLCVLTDAFFFSFFF